MQQPELLRRWADDRDTAAFAQLVRLHSDWINASARRQLGDDHLAEDATQAVFLLLARKASHLKQYRYLHGWLLKALRYCVCETRRQEARRRRREQEVAMHARAAPEARWEEIAPILDEAVTRLAAKDRDAVLLRFYKGLSFDEVGGAMGVSEDAARKRVSRAVEKLREKLRRQGVAAGPAMSMGLGTLLSERITEAAPANVLQHSLAPAGSRGLALAKGAMKMMALYRIKVAGSILGLMALTAAGLAAVAPASKSDKAQVPPPPVITPELATVEAKHRLLRFPSDRSLGRILVQDASLKREIVSFHHWIDGVSWHANSDYLGEARGDVVIPEGKRVALLVSDQGGKDLSGLAWLDPRSLHALMLPNTYAGDGLQFVGRLAGLKELELWGSISDKQLAPLAALTSLEVLTLGENVGSGGLSYAVRMPTLRRLYVRSQQLTDRHLSALKSMGQLEELCLYSPKITGTGLAQLEHLKSLQYFAVNSGVPTDADMAHFQKVPSLRILSLGHCRIGDEGVRHLAGHPGIERLSLYNTRVTDRGLVHLATIPNLKMLTIDKRGATKDITDAGLVHLSRIAGLTYLDLPYGAITDAGFAEIAKLKCLKHLWASGASNSPLTDSALMQISKLGELEYLLISGAGITDAGVRHLTGLRQLKELNLDGALTADGLRTIGTLSSLDTLTLDHALTLSDLACLNRLTHLKSLRVCRPSMGAAPLDLSGLERLEELTITGLPDEPGLGDADLACLKNLKQLRSLQVNANRMTDAGMKSLAGLTRMERLSIGSAHLTDAALAELAGMTQLDELRTYGRFSDAGLAHLESLRSLTILKLQSSGTFSSHAIGKLRRSLLNVPDTPATHFQVEQDCPFKKAKVHKQEGAHVRVGRLAPSFAVLTMDGKPLRIEDFRGKVLILQFWATWNEDSVRLMTRVARSHRELKAEFGDRYEMIGMNMDTSDEPVLKFVKEKGISWPQARLGLQSTIAADYGVEDDPPKHFLIGPDGILRLAPDSPQVNTQSYIRNLLVGAAPSANTRTP